MVRCQNHVYMCSVAKLCQILCEPIDCSLPGSSVHAISQARILEWDSISSSKESSQSRDWILISFIGRQILYHCATWDAYQSTIYCWSCTPLTFVYLFIHTHTHTHTYVYMKSLKWLSSVCVRACVHTHSASSLSPVWLFVTYWTIALQALCPGIFQARTLEWVAISSFCIYVYMCV